MEEAQRQLLLQQQQNQQNHHYQQFLLLQQLQKQQQHHVGAGAGGSSFQSNIDVANLRPQGLRPINFHPNPNPNLQFQQQLQQQIPNLFQQTPHNQQQQQNTSMQLQQNPNVQQEKSVAAIRPVNQAELQMAYQDAWRICNPDMRKPFSSLQDACERLVPYHVIADYEAEEDDRILESDSTGQMLSRSQLWDQNIAAKVAEFTCTFEKQVQAFNLITHKRATGEFRSEERLMIEQALLQNEKRSILELRSEMANREAHEARMRMAMAAQRADVQAQAEMMRGLIRASAFGSQGINSIPMMSRGMAEQGQGGNNPDDDAMMNGWGNNAEKEPSDDFLNDEENENGDADTQDGWRDAGDFDLNRR